MYLSFISTEDIKPKANANANPNPTDPANSNPTYHTNPTHNLTWAICNLRTSSVYTHVRS